MTKIQVSRAKQRRKLDGDFWDLHWQEYSDGNWSLNAYRPGESFPVKFITDSSREKCLAQFVLFLRER